MMKIGRVHVCCLALACSSVTWVAQGLARSDATPEERAKNPPVSAANSWNAKVIEEFRANGGKVGGRFANTNLLLLHTTGAKSGLPRLVPLVYLADGTRLIVIASNGGAPRSPHWYYNLVVNPNVRVEVGTEQFQAQAAVAQEPERTKLFEQMAARIPAFATYKQKAAPRIIPVVILTRKP